MQRNDSETKGFQLLGLHDKKDRSYQSWIYASGKDLQNIVKNLLNSEKVEEIVEGLKKEIASYRNKSKTLIYLKNLLSSIETGAPVTWFPLVLLVRLSKNTHEEEITAHIDKLGTVKDNNKIVEVRAVKKLDKKFAKLLGVHAADGSISHYDGQIWVKDENYYNLVLVKTLFEDVFGLSPKIIKLKKADAYGLYVNNKVIMRYFTKIFGFAEGYKADSVSTPEMLRCSSFEIKKSFASGVLMADGCVGFDGKISINCKSKRLVEDVHSILLEDGLRVADIRNSIHNGKSMWYFSAPAPTKMTEIEKLKWLECFDHNSDKWYRVKENVFGQLEGKVNEYEVVEKIFSLAYPGGNNSKIKLTDVIKVVEKLDVIEQKQLAKILNVDLSTVSKYVKILKTANILAVVKRKKSKGVGKGSSPFIYSFNKIVSEWKVPYRQFNLQGPVEKEV